MPRSSWRRVCGVWFGAHGGVVMRSRAKYLWFGGSWVAWLPGEIPGHAMAEGNFESAEAAMLEVDSIVTALYDWKAGRTKSLDEIRAELFADYPMEREG